MLSLPKVFALLGLDFLLGCIGGWTFCSMFRRRRGNVAATPSEPATSALDVSGLLKETTELAERHAAGLERFSLFRRDVEDCRNPAVDEAFAAQREASECWLRLFSDRSERLELVTRNGWERCRPAADALTKYHGLVANYADQLRTADGDLATNAALGVLVAQLLEANLTLTNSLASAHELLVEFDEQLREAERSAKCDPLTGLPNRRGFDDHLRRLHSHWVREGDRPFSLVLFDIDHFKKLNDEHGHDTGDAVLRMIANVLRDESRACDYVSRWGGEEFAVLAAHTAAPAAKVLANRLRRRIEASELHQGGEIVKCTVSAGIAEIGPATSVTELFRLADGALYESKSAGRNAVHVAETTSTERAPEAPVEAALQPA